MSGENSWIKGIDPALLPYTKKYQITYPDNSKETVYGLKAISEKFNVSIANVYATIERIKKGNIPRRGAMTGVIIEELKI